MAKKKRKSLGLPIDKPWTHPDFRPAFEKELARLDVKMKPLTDALEESGRIGPEDLNIYIGPVPGDH